MSDGVFIGALNVMDVAAGYWFDNFVAGAPTVGVPEVRGQRVLIPGRAGLYTPDDNFEVDHMLVALKGTVWGVGLTPALRRVAFRSAVAALKTACAVSTRADVTISAHGPQVEGLASGATAAIAAGFLRFESTTPLGWETWETVIEFDATDPPEWAIS